MCSSSKVYAGNILGLFVAEVQYRTCEPLITGDNNYWGGVSDGGKEKVRVRLAYHKPAVYGKRFCPGMLQVQ